MEKWKFLTLPGLEPRPLSSPASRYTNCAIPALVGVTRLSINKDEDIDRNKEVLIKQKITILKKLHVLIKPSDTLQGSEVLTAAVMKSSVCRDFNGLHGVISWYFEDGSKSEQAWTHGVQSGRKLKGRNEEQETSVGSVSQTAPHSLCVRQSANFPRSPAWYLVTWLFPYRLPLHHTTSWEHLP
jgi:hypothetical protein